MDKFAATASLLQSFVGFVIGVHLLRLGLRNRGTLERLIGLSWLVSATANLTWLASALVDYTGRARLIFGLATMMLSALGSGLVLTVCWWIFRRRSAWGIGLYVTILGLLTVGSVSLYPAYVWSRALPYLWIAVESFLVQGQLRKRLRYGLEPDRTLADQMMFLSGATLAGGLSYVSIAIWDLHYRPLPVRELVAALSFLSAIFSWLAFLPPKRFLEWSGRRSSDG